MKVLIIAKCNAGKFSPFVVEQAESLRSIGVDIDYYGITEKGIKGYLNIKRLMQKIKSFHPDILHAHYGLSGFLANLQRNIPIVTTFHGCDVNSIKLRWISRIVMYFSSYVIFVNRKMPDIIHARTAYSVIPCGVDTTVFFPLDQKIAKQKLGWRLEERKILFAGAFQNRVKNYKLAYEAVRKLRKVDLVELDGYDRKTVNLLLNACDLVLLTSIREGSPQIIKEAISCNCPIVSVDVGDVKELVAGLENCFVCQHSADDLSDKIISVLERPKVIEERKSINKLGLSLQAVAYKIKSIYCDVLDVNIKL